jgi:hypothetical protein
MPEGVEAPLLSAEGGRGGPSGRRLQVLVQPLVAAILVRAGGLDELGANPESEPPDAELGEPAEGAGGEGLPVIRADPLGEPMGAEEAAKDLLSRFEQGTLEPVAGQEIARE